MAESTSYDLILSINGKQVVVASWTDPASKHNTLEWVRKTFKDMVVAYYGINQSQREREFPNAPYCKDHQLPMVWRSGKYGSFWSCPHRGEDGSYCKYKAPKA